MDATRCGGVIGNDIGVVMQVAGRSVPIGVKAARAVPVHCEELRLAVQGRAPRRGRSGGAGRTAPLTNVRRRPDAG